MEKRKAKRQRCGVSGRILLFGDEMASIECQLIDITDFGALLRLDPTTPVPHRFELMIGTDPNTHPCRLVRQTASGFGIEFLDPIRNEIEASLIDRFFKEELLVEAAYGRPLRHSPVRKRLNAMVEDMMRITIERGRTRNADALQLEEAPDPQPKGK